MSFCIGVLLICFALFVSVVGDCWWWCHGAGVPPGVRLKLLVAFVSLTQSECACMARVLGDLIYLFFLIV